jgi:hypothetical protein
MSAYRPEADTEYSRGPRGSRGRAGAAGAPQSARQNGASMGVVAAAAAGAVLLLVAEFAPLLRVRSSAYGAGVVQTISAGSHHSYALVPVAILAVAMAVVARASGNRLALASIGVLGLVALGVALLGDLPDAHASGLIRHAGGYAAATSSVAVGFYLETLGGLLLLLAAAAGLLLAGNRDGIRSIGRSSDGGPLPDRETP